ncbi:unnamed protein product [Moneuplotes crassus]|uniref:Uncharacterized protein n=1 Tax=Euplotes crassus TaxID=5936 RepID=A0AAD1U8E0_EUPCR|nr:unnamed protein product [Moneuplotes crassus]
MQKGVKRVPENLVNSAAALSNYNKYRAHRVNKDYTPTRKVTQLGNLNDNFLSAAEGYNIGVSDQEEGKQKNVLSSLCGLPKAFQGKKLNPIPKGYVPKMEKNTDGLSNSKANINPLRKLENMSTSYSKLRNTSYSLFNDPSDTESGIPPIDNPESKKADKNVLKLAEETLSFIDRELTKSYKVTSIGQERPPKCSPNGEMLQSIKEESFKLQDTPQKRRNPLKSLRQLKTYSSNHPMLNTSTGKINLTSSNDETESTTASFGINYFRKSNSKCTLQNCHSLKVTSDHEIQLIEKSLIIGIKDINDTYLASIGESDTGVIPSLSNFNGTMEYDSESREQFQKLVVLYSHTMDSIMAHDNRYKNIFQILKTGCIQTLAAQNKALENMMAKFQGKTRQLEIQCRSKNKELEISTKELKRLRAEKDQLLERLKKTPSNISLMNQKGKSYSSRSFTSNSPGKPTSRKTYRKEVESDLLKFIMFLEEKAIPVIKIYREEYQKIKDKNKNYIKYDINLKKLKSDLFGNNSPLKNKPAPKPDNYFSKNLLNNQISMAGMSKKAKVEGHDNTPSRISNNNCSEIGRMSFHSEDSFHPLNYGPPVSQEKPSCVPTLSLNAIDKYFNYY